MPCNLNFNQCNGGSYYPCPIFNCRCRLLNLLTGSSNTVINPVITPSWAFFNFTTPQTVLPNGNVIFNMVSGAGINILTGANGVINLDIGTYQISYNANGAISSNGTLALALFNNGDIIPASESQSSGVVGDAATLSGSVVINITENGSPVSLRNINNVSEVFSSGTLTVTKV